MQASEVQTCPDGLAAHYADAEKADTHIDESLPETLTRLAAAMIAAAMIAGAWSTPVEGVQQGQSRSPVPVSPLHQNRDTSGAVHPGAAGPLLDRLAKEPMGFITLRK